MEYSILRFCKGDMKQWKYWDVAEVYQSKRKSSNAGLGYEDAKNCYESMMQFFRSQNFQIILATPPGKIETIGEYVDTILVTYRSGYSSIVEEYYI